jgi:DNA-binding FadR family transcriptional regulator
MNYTTRIRRSHNRVVFECYQAIKKAEESNDTDKLLRVMSRYGKKTRDDAIKMLEEDAAERCGMSYEEYHKEVMSEM